MKLFNVKQLNTMLRYALKYTDFETESLANYDNQAKLPALSQDLINTLFAQIADLRLEPGEIQFKERIGGICNSYDWCRIVKYMIGNTAIIDKNEHDLESHKLLTNWAQFITSIKDICFNKIDPFTGEQTKENLITKTSASPNEMFNNFFTGEKSETAITSLSASSAEFKNFIGQLIKDGYFEQANAIHLMLQYCANIVSKESENGMSAFYVAKMFGVPLFMGFECDKVFMQGENIKEVANICLVRHQQVNSTFFASYLEIVLKDTLFLHNFHVSHYGDYEQSYSEAILGDLQALLNNPIEIRMQEIKKEELKKSSHGAKTKFNLKLPSPRHNKELSRTKSVESKSNELRLNSFSSSHSDSLHESHHAKEKREPSPRKPRGNSKGATVSSSAMEHTVFESESPTRTDNRGSASPHRRGNLTTSTPSLASTLEFNRMEIPKPLVSEHGASKKSHKVISPAFHKVQDNTKPVTNSAADLEQIEAILHTELEKLHLDSHTDKEPPHKPYLVNYQADSPSIVLSDKEVHSNRDIKPKSKSRSNYAKTT